MCVAKHNPAVNDWAIFDCACRQYDQSEPVNFYDSTDTVLLCLGDRVFQKQRHGRHI